MPMRTNILREKLNRGEPTVATRIWSVWPTVAEAAAASGKFDYLEFVGEYAPYNQVDLENFARTCELWNTASMIKVEFQNRFFTAQKALCSGFQAILFTDHKTPDDVAQSLRAVRPDNEEYGGRFGYPNGRWIGYQPYREQRDHAAMVNDAVKVFMIEKYEAMQNLDEICSIPGVDMVQFGPSDYSMSRGWTLAEHKEEVREAEEEMIRIALKHGVQARCEIDSFEQAEHYAKLGVRHFNIGDQFRIMKDYWNNVGGAVRDLAEKL